MYSISEEEFSKFEEGKEFVVDKEIEENFYSKRDFSNGMRIVIVNEIDKDIMVEVYGHFGWTHFIVKYYWIIPVSTITFCILCIGIIAIVILFVNNRESRKTYEEI